METRARLSSVRLGGKKRMNEREKYLNDATSEVLKGFRRESGVKILISPVQPIINRRFFFFLISALIYLKSYIILCIGFLQEGGPEFLRIAGMEVD